MTWPATNAERGSLPWLRREVGLRLGYPPDPAVWDYTQRGQVDSVIDSGLNRFYFPPPGEFTIANATEAQKDRLRRAPHAWSFLQKITSINTVAGQTEYTLPANFASFIGDPTTDRVSGRIAVVAEAQLRQLIDSSTETGDPAYCAVRYTAGDGTAKPAPKLVLYPIPSGVEEIKVQHAITPPSLTDAAPWPLSGVEHAETILSCCYAVIAERSGQDPASAITLMLQRLTSSIMLDMQTAAPSSDGVWPEDDDASLGVGRPYIEKMIGLKLGYGPAVRSWTKAQKAKVQEIYKAGMRRVVNPPVLPGEKYPHQWTWLRPLATLNTVAGQSVYSLPADFSTSDGPITHAMETYNLYPPIEIIGELAVRNRLQSQNVTGRPTVAAVRLKTPFNPSDGTRWELLLWPVPDAAYALEFRYRINPEALAG